MDRASAKAVIAATYFLGCLCLLSQGVMDFGSAALSVLIFISGMCINGAQNGLQAYSPAYYQTEIRATGVSWMHGIGRTGGYPQLHAGRDADAGRAGTLVDLFGACAAGLPGGDLYFVAPYESR